MSIRTIGNRKYLIGKSHATGQYTTWELKRGKWVHDFCTSDFEIFRAHIKHLQDLADKREARAMIADMGGTSYTAAMADMGQRRF